MGIYEGQKISKLNLVSFSSEEEAYKLNLAAAEGPCCYGGAEHLLQSGGGPIFTAENGIYTKDCFYWLNPATRNSLFRAWRVLSRDSKYLEQLTEIVAYENRQGFNLVNLIPLNGFPERSRGKGTYGVFALFERLGNSCAPLALDKWLLRKERIVNSDMVPCPVIGCDFVAPRMHKGEDLNSSPNALNDYLCPYHRIFISPTTFAYEDPMVSLLWERDRSMVREITNAGKRTWSRQGRERDEDSLTWNVFRYLERNKRLEDLLESLMTESLEKSALFSTNQGTIEKMIYWSVDVNDPHPKVWDVLLKVRQKIGEKPFAGSEPDLIAVLPNWVIFVEIKYESSSVTPVKNIPECYQNVDKDTWDRIFSKEIDQVIGNIGYQLMRFFLLGNILAEQLNKNFFMISITKSGWDDQLAQSIEVVVNSNNYVPFKQATWSEILDFISRDPRTGSFEKTIIVRYLKGKTAGYDAKGKLMTLLPDSK
jgi:hypothetical protein